MKEATPPPEQAALVARYEELRAIAVAPRITASSSSSGFALLVRQGVAAWTHAWAECAPLHQPRQERPFRAVSGSTDASALVDVLTQMALAGRTQQRISL